MLERLLKGMLPLVAAGTLAAPTLAQDTIFGSGSLKDPDLRRARVEGEAKALAAGFPRENAVLEEMAGGSTHLTRFGFTGACQEEYQADTAPFTNTCVIGIDDERLRDPAWTGKLMTAGTKFVVTTHDTLYELVRPPTPQEPFPPFDLRSDYRERWQAAIAGKEAAIGGLVAFIYLADEPNWTGISRAELQQAHDLVKESFPLIPTLTSLNHVNVAQWLGSGQILTDAVGYHQYAVLDPRTDPLYQSNLATIKAHAVGKPFVNVMDAFFDPTHHGAAGLTPDTMDDVARNYHAMAEADPSAVALVGFHWPDLYGPVIGAHSLPTDVQQAYHEIGSEVTGKCLAPPWIEPRNAMFFHGCEFVADVQYWAHGVPGMSTALPHSDISNNYWNFDETNLEGTLKIFDLRPLGIGWGVYLTSNSDLRLKGRIFRAVDEQHHQYDPTPVWNYDHPGGALSVVEAFQD